MLVLLIIFMVITPMLQNGVSVDMAKVNNPIPMPDADKEDALLIAVMRDGQIYFGTDRVKADELSGKVKDRLANKVDKRVFIKADARAKYGNVVDVVDNVRSAGVDDVGLLTEQKQTGAAGKKPPKPAPARVLARSRGSIFMSMAMAGSGGPSADINVTPLIDVLLVLLIVFMVITPLTPKGLDALVPQPPKDQQKQPPPSDRTIVVQVLKGAGDKPSLKINQDDVTWENLEGRLNDIFKTRAEKVMFVKADPDLTFNDVAQVIDIAHAAGVDKVGLITAKIEAGG